MQVNQLRHTIATQLLNADTDLVTIQDLFGQYRISNYVYTANLQLLRDFSLFPIILVMHHIYYHEPQ